MTEEKFRSYGLKGGPAMRLARPSKKSRSVRSPHELKHAQEKADVAFDYEYEYVYGIVTTVSNTEYRISLTEDAIKNPTELRKNVKRVLEVIVGLLKDRVSASDKPANKKRRVEEIIKKK
ncbi:hypothetical protein RhiirA4_481712 [Rhizophagus irregularis]|uniref:Uncharacterized protein n=1 Tax=Rhizophagus irregularis TaxID=588596 RepID=A0A2I1HJX1_9GLOM|nr:hypothetical protein RhiirA4_481712 [Rhizophagus irregularis]